MGHFASKNNGNLKTRRLERQPQPEQPGCWWPSAIMDSIVGFLGFKTEIGGDFPEQKLPTLDVNIWISEGMIMKEYYEKPWGQYCPPCKDSPQ
jgi:hypothetical protein